LVFSVLAFPPDGLRPPKGEAGGKAGLGRLLGIPGGPAQGSWNFTRGPLWPKSGGGAQRGGRPPAPSSPSPRGEPTTAQGPHFRFRRLLWWGAGLPAPTGGGILIQAFLVCPFGRSRWFRPLRLFSLAQSLRWGGGGGRRWLGRSFQPLPPPLGRTVFRGAFLSFFVLKAFGPQGRGGRHCHTRRAFSRPLHFTGSPGGQRGGGERKRPENPIAGLPGVLLYLPHRTPDASAEIVLATTQFAPQSLLRNTPARFCFAGRGPTAKRPRAGREGGFLG